MSYVNLSKMPDAKKEYNLSFPQLKGGLNTELLDFQLNSNESPNMRNLKWRDGVIGSRYGQVWSCKDEAGNPIELGRAFSAYDRLWYGRLVVHAGTRIYCFDPKGKSIITVCDDIPQCRGTFFAYGENLYYKTKGGYYKFSLTNNLEAEIIDPSSFKLQYPLDGYYTFQYKSIGCNFSVVGTLVGEREYTVDTYGSMASLVLTLDGMTMNRPSVGDTLTVVRTTVDYVTTLTITQQSSGLNAAIYSADIFNEKYPNDGTYVFTCSSSSQILRLCSVNAYGTNYSDVSAVEEGNYIKFHGIKIRQPRENDTVRVHAEGINLDIEELDIEATNVAQTAYVPVTYINATPQNGSGDSYQPENRLSAKKTIWYNAEQKITAVASTGLSVEVVETTFLSKNPGSGTFVFTYDGTSWSTAGGVVQLYEFGISCSGTPSANDTITVTSQAVKDYHLPVKATSIHSVYVNDVLQDEDVFVVWASSGINVTVDFDHWTSVITSSAIKVFIYSGGAWSSEGQTYSTAALATTFGITVTGTISEGSQFSVTYTKNEYVYEPTTGILKFWTAPPVTVPATNNTVKITYVLSNDTAYNNIMDCEYAITYGGTGSLCIVMAGSDTQPNAYFWNGQTSVGMDPSYFPMEQYQLAGDVVDPITGFGKQQSYLIIFKKHSVGRTIADTTEIDDRAYIDMPYTAINVKNGCDLPWTIQLIENNLTWCNTEQGVCFLADTSAAYENNIIRISDKINNGSSRSGILYDLRHDSANTICSVDDEHKYAVCANNHCWLWDYDISNYKDPTWFFYTNIGAKAFVHEIDETWHLDSVGRITYFENVFSDYGEPIDKLYEFAVQNFGSYEYLKNINTVIFIMRPDTVSTVRVQYVTDYENRYDLNNLETTVWKLSPRDLSERDMRGSGYAGVMKRRPMCRRVRHFTMILTNNTAGEDLGISSAQIFYTFQGRQR